MGGTPLHGFYPRIGIQVRGPPATQKCDWSRKNTVIPKDTRNHRNSMQMKGGQCNADAHLRFKKSRVAATMSDCAMPNMPTCASIAKVSPEGSQLWRVSTSFFEPINCEGKPRGIATVGRVEIIKYSNPVVMRKATGGKETKGTKMKRRQKERRPIPRGIVRDRPKRRKE